MPQNESSAGRYDLSQYDDVMMNVVSFQVTSLAIVYSSVYSNAEEREHESSASLAFVRGIYR